MYPCPNCASDLEISLPERTIGINTLGEEIEIQQGKRYRKSACENCGTIIPLSLDIVVDTSLQDKTDYIMGYFNK